MEDINEALYGIIIKYSLDMYYPNFRKRLEGERCLRNFLAQRTGRVAFIASCQSEIAQFRHFVRLGEKADCFVCERTNRYEESYAAAYDVKKLVKVDWSRYSTVLVVSLEGSSFIRHWLRQHAVSHIFLYDWFAGQGIFFDKEWDSLFGDPALEWWSAHEGSTARRKYVVMELVEQLQAYRAAREVEERRYHLHKAYFMALYIRDFLLAEKCVTRMEAGSEQQNASWKEIQALLARIQQRLRQRTERDILVLWTDELSREGEFEQVPFLKQKIAAGVSFDNMFTVCPNTNPTLKGILCGKLPVDEDTYAIEEITEENSPVYRLLARHGYEICVIGAWPAIRKEELSSMLHWWGEPASLGLWDVWRSLLLSEKPLFCLVHALGETHDPSLSPDITDEDIADPVRRFEKSCRWLNEQYFYYLPKLPEAMMKIYMTDHGKPFHKTCHHVYLTVEEEGLLPRRVDSLCSLLDFQYLFQQLLEERQIDEARLQRDYVRVQNLDWYNPATVGRFIAKRHYFSPFMFGFRGVVTRDYMYLHFTDGREWFVRRGTDAPPPNVFGSYLCDETAIEPLRAILREKEPLSSSLVEKLRYARYFHRILDKAKARNLQKKALIEAWLASYPPHSVLIRTGGADAVQAYEMLSEEAKERIGGFVDQNLHCACAALHLPVYASLAAVPREARAIFLASHDLIAHLREEAAAYVDRCDVLDPYEFLADHGIVCRYGVGAFEAADEEYDVGFPFDEVVY